MKIFHTSDWHLGQTFIGKSREAEHRAFLDWLSDQIQEKQADALIIAGDIFDTGTPPSYARSMYNDWVIRMRDLNCQLVILGGNHDSVATLNESAGLLQALNAQVIGGVCDDIEQQVIILKGRQAQSLAVCCAIPFIRPRDVVESVAAQTGQDKQQALIQGMANHFNAVYQKALEKRLELAQVHQISIEQIPIIATGHLTTLASSNSESMRDIYVGTLDSFPSDYLPPADYVALGHIHKPMSVSGKNHIRYSGSPIHLSFDELHYQKQIVEVTFDQSCTPNIQSIEIPRFQPMYNVKGDLNMIQEQLSQLNEDHKTGNQRVWVEVLVEFDDYLSDLQQKINTIVEDTCIDVVKVKRQKTSKQSLHTQSDKRGLGELKPDEVFAFRLENETLDASTKEKLMTRFRMVHAELTEPENTIEKTSAEPIKA